MILTGPEIEKERALGAIDIEPFVAEQLNPNSYNVRLGSVLMRYTAEVLDTAHPNPVETLSLSSDGYVLEPTELYLGHTVESVGSTRHVPMLFGRSSVGRVGLFVEITAPIGDIGFLGQWTLMLNPILPIRVYPGMEIGQIMFFRSHGTISAYSGKYQGAQGPRQSEIWRGRVSTTQAPEQSL